MIVSHHPEVLDYLALDSLWRFERPSGPVDCQAFPLRRHRVSLKLSGARGSGSRLRVQRRPRCSLVRTWSRNGYSARFTSAIFTGSPWSLGSPTEEPASSCRFGAWQPTFANITRKRSAARGDRRRCAGRVERLAAIGEAAGFSGAPWEERIARCVPSRSVETWEMWLCGEREIDEQTSYKQTLSRDRRGGTKSARRAVEAWFAILTPSNSKPRRAASRPWPMAGKRSPDCKNSPESNSPVHQRDRATLKFMRADLLQMAADLARREVSSGW